MTHPEELAELLVAYDRRFAGSIVELIVAKLGGPLGDGAFDVNRAHAFLSRTDSASVVDEPRTTSEWKIDFAHRERLRSLGLVLAERLD